MKTFLLLLFVLIIVISLAVYGLKYWQTASEQGQTPIVIQNTLTGVLKPVSSTGEYSDVLVSGNKTVGVTSNKIDLRPYENRKVKIIGGYSGNTFYADSITLLP